MMTANVRGMKWYVAKLVYQVICGDGNHTPQFDEQYRLIRADELQWAWEKAQILGKLDECTLCNEQCHEVKWRFIDVADVCEIMNQEDGAVLFSQTVEAGNAEDYIALTRAKAIRFSSVITQ